MSEAAVLSASVRKEKGSLAARRVRAVGKIHAILYGHKEANVPLVVDNKEVQTLVKHHAHGLLELNIDGKAESAVIKDLQWDVFGREILHVDFTRVSKGELIRLEVPIVFKGVAPGIAEGGVLDQPMHSIEIECPSDNIQETIVVNINGLHLGQSIHVKELVAPEGARVLADPDMIVVQVMKPRLVSDEAVPAAEGSAEPELIRREAKPAEGEEE